MENLQRKSNLIVQQQSYTLEIGGKGKSSKQLEGINHSFIAMDDIEAGIGTKIPLWMFGMLY